MDRVGALTGMRGVAALLVLGFHCVLVFWLAQITFGWEADAFGHPLSEGFFGAGWVGVDFFFVLSGFLLSRPLLGGGTALPVWARYRVFAAKRLLRIAPPYYASFLAIYLLAGWTGHPIYAMSFEGFAVHALYLHNFFPEHQFAVSGVAWTLAVELQFYLLLPLLVLPFRRYGPWVSVLFLAAALAFLAYAYDPADPGRTRFLVFQLPAFLGHFGFGIAAAQLHDTGHWPRAFRPDIAILASAAALIVAPAAVLGYSDSFDAPNELLFHALVRPAAGLAFAIIILAALRPGSVTGLALTWRPLLWTGEISYSLYLIHLAVGGVFLVNEWQWAFHFGLAPFMLMMSAASLVLAWLFFHAVEKPSLRLKDRVTALLERAPPA